MKETSDPFTTFKFDGVLGLSRMSMAQAPSFSIVEQLTQNGAFKKPIFAVFFSLGDDDSEITFGQFRNTHMASKMIWFDVMQSSGYWQLQIEDITLENEKAGMCEDCKVAVDTGTSDLAGPTEV